MARRKQKNKKNFGLRFLLLIIVVFTVFMISASISYKFIVQYQEQLEASGEIVIPQNEQILFEVPKGATTSDIARKLQREGFISNAKFFELWSEIQGYNGDYKAGIHIISKNLSMEGIMMVLTSNPVADPSLNVRFYEGKSYIVARELMSADGKIDKDKMDNVVINPEFEYKFLKDIPDRKYKLEGYLYPQTYQIEEGWSEEQIIDRALKYLNKLFKEEYYTRSQEMNMTIDQVFTLASLIESEAKYEEDKKIISSVFHNRLEINMPLQSDATIQYILENQGKERVEVVLNEHTSIQDPYNTYQYKGLPPGPICSPDIASIEAALYPEDTDYLYFFAKPDGNNEYNVSFEDHTNGMRKYGLIK